MPRAAVVILGAGSGTRVGAARNKILLPLLDVPVIGWSVRTVLATEGVDTVVVVCRTDEREAMGDALAPLLGDRELHLVDGGPTRHQSEWAALRLLAERVDRGDLDVIAIHDGARPLASTELFARTIEVARDHGSAVPAAPLTGLIPRDPQRSDLIELTTSARLVGVQTPQAFRAAPLLEAFRRAETDGFEGTDTAACLATYGDLPIRAVPSTPTNLKVTYPEDLRLAEQLLQQPAQN